jgi:hypothetical protein
VLILRATGRNIVFHLNHPIAFIRVTGTLTSITDCSASWTLFTLDDSSGRSIEVKLSRLPQWLAESPETPSNTAVSNVHVRTEGGSFDLVIDGQIADIGTMVSAKGTVDEWRGERQLVLKRIQLIKTTAAETQEWVKMAEFKQRVLNRPWELSDEERIKIDDEIEQASKRRLAKEKLRREHYARKQEKKRIFEEKRQLREDELERRRKERESYYNRGAII